jgi:hypothetical protein
MVPVRADGSNLLILLDRDLESAGVFRPVQGLDGPRGRIAERDVPPRLSNCLMGDSRLNESWARLGSAGYHRQSGTRAFSAAQGGSRASGGPVFPRRAWRALPLLGAFRTHGDPMEYFWEQF